MLDSGSVSCKGSKKSKFARSVTSRKCKYCTFSKGRQV